VGIDMIDFLRLQPCIPEAIRIHLAAPSPSGEGAVM
jgi:hypothetical protein